MSWNYNLVRGQGTHLVSVPRQSSGNTRLTLGQYLADVVVSNKKDEKCCHYVIQRLGSAEILELGKSDDFAAAKAEAERALERWHLRDQNFKAS